MLPTPPTPRGDSAPDSPDPADPAQDAATRQRERELDAELDGTFPASDPPSMTDPSAATGAAPRLHGAHADQHAPVVLYRVVEEHQSHKPFGGRGADRGGRWTSPGVPGVYTALSPAGALLEYLAHAEGDTPKVLYMASATIPARCLLTQAVFPSHWRDRPYRADVRQVGDAWSREHASLALRVPSALCEGACNALLNPEHVDAPLLQSVTLTPLSLDSRLRM